MKRIPSTGVNLGGWFIPEKWMSPDLFDGTDADDLYRLLKTKNGVQRYKTHLKNWITEQDFAWLAEHNVGVVRLPIGYWAAGAAEPYPDVSSTLTWAFLMAEKYNLQILLDLHGLKGSQNGKDHSGQIGETHWKNYQAETIATLVRLAQKFGNSKAFWGIEIMNEPYIKGQYFTLLRFYRTAYRALKAVLPDGVNTVFSDGFLLLLFSGALRASRRHPVVMDIHIYAMPNFLTPNKRIYFLLRRCVYWVLIRLCLLSQPVIIGEWSAVLPQRLFNQTNKEQHRALMAENIAEQQKIYRHATASMYWNYKTKGKGMWNFRSLVESDDLEVI